MPSELRAALAESKAALLELLSTLAGQVVAQAIRGEQTFPDLGLDVALKVPGLGEVWLVARPTGRDRPELTPADVTAIALVQAEFPNAEVVSITRRRIRSPMSVHEPAAPDTSHVRSV
jgi:hypothetical protein